MTTGSVSIKVNVMGKKTLTIILGILALAGAASAQGIAIVDSEKVLAEFEDAKIARGKLQQSILLWKAELDSLNRAYQDAEAEFKAQQPMLSEDALRAIQEELSAMQWG